MNKQYPPQTGPYVVKVRSNKSTDSWQNFDTARLQISVGQEYHEGEKFVSLVAWCKHRFNSVAICANDTLQRFNLMFEKHIDEAQALKETSELGRQWIERSMPIIKGLPNAKIIRWDDWKAKESFKKGRLSTEWLYTNNNEFKGAIDHNIMEIWKRRKAMRPDVYNISNFDEFFKLSREYLLEETAGFSAMFESEQGIDIYPGTVLFAVSLFRGRQVEGAPDGLGKGHFSRVDFVKNKNYQL